MRPADVVVVGAGPAGAVAALRCARAGLRVRLFDRAAFPRDKLCGDSINPGALTILRRLGVAEAIERRGLPIRGWLVSGAGGTCVAGEYGHGVRGVSIRRRDLDWLLVQAAAAAGVEFEPGVSAEAPVVDASGGRRRVIGVRVRTGQCSHICPAPLTIAADGRRSALAFQLGLSHHPPSPRRWAIGAYFDGVPVEPGLGEMHIRPRRYIGIADVPGGLTNTCLVVSEPRRGALADPEAVLLATLRNDPQLGGRFGAARLAAAPVVVGPLAVDCRCPGIEGLLLAGDAAGFIDPMTGDGLRFAFRGGELAADVAIDLLQGDVTDAPAALADRRRRAFAGKWRLDRLLRSLVASPAALSWATRGARVFPAAVQRLVRTAGDVP